MGKTVIIADSAVDLNSSLRESFGIADYVHVLEVKMQELKHYGEMVLEQKKRGK